MHDRFDLSANTVNCPYCNAAMSLTAEDLQQPRIRCPRCGDRFPNRRYNSQTVAAGFQPCRSDKARLESCPTKAGGVPSRTINAIRKRNTETARRILMLMAAAAALALVFMLATVRFRRSKDLPKIKSNVTEKKGILPPPFLVQPGESAALSYLPHGCQLVAGWHVREMLQTKEGREFWKALRRQDYKTKLKSVLRDPADGIHWQDWNPAATFGQTIVQIERKIGLRAKDLDNWALGVLFQKDLPEFVLIARTRQPYDAKKIAAAVGAEKSSSFRKRPVYRIRLKPVGDGLVWLRDSTTVVVHIDPFLAKIEDLEQHPSVPKPGSGWSDNPAHALVKQLNRETFLWAAGEPAKIRQLDGLLKWLPAAKADIRRQIRNVKTFAIGVRFQKGVTLDGMFACKDEESAQALYRFVKSSLQDLETHYPKYVNSYTVVEPAAGAEKEQARLRVAIQIRLNAAQASKIRNK